MGINLVFRVGVTGKRKLDLNQADWAASQIEFILKAIKSAVVDARQKAGELYCGESAELRAVSPLAEGADRIFAGKALELDYKLDCPLPFPADEYVKDFPATQAEFKSLLDRADRMFELDGSRSAGYPYEAVGRFVLDHCDILIAIWDGKPACGMGGTAHIMQIAGQEQTPVVCLRVDQIQSNREQAEGMEAEIRAIVDRLVLPAPPPAPEPSAKDRWLLRSLRAIYKRIILPPLRWLSRKLQGPVEKCCGRLLPPLWAIFENTLSGEKPERIPLPSDCDVVKATPNLPKPEYDAANEPARRLAGLYRGAFVANYTFGTLAVFFALFEYANRCNSKLWLSLELAAISVVILLVTFLSSWEWHHRSIDNRYLAEQLRIYNFIRHLGLPPPRPRVPAHYIESNLQRSWMEFQLRALARTAPMPKGSFDAPGLAERLRKIRCEWLNGQMNYHNGVQSRHHTMERCLHVLGSVFVAIAALGCVAHFFIHGDSSKWLTVAAAGFPAAAGACHAISTQGEFRRLAKRSEAMLKGLEQTEKRLAALAAQPPTSEVLRVEVRQLSQLMLEEVVDWQVLYRKDLAAG